LNYRVVHTQNGIIYRVGHRFHVISLLFALFLLWGFSLNISEGGAPSSMIHIIILFFIAVSGALYRDTWLFDTQKRMIYSIWGFGPIVSQATVPFEEVERLELTHFIKGSSAHSGTFIKRRGRPMVVFALRTIHEEERTIRIMARRRSAGRVEEAARIIGAATSLALFIDGPEDQENEFGLDDR
jgi:hypothetical protein